MIKGVIIKKLNKYTDNRGWLCEIFRNNENTLKSAMGYVSETKSGVIRGPHEHQKQNDFFIFLGPGKFKLYLWENRKGQKSFHKLYTYEFGEGAAASVIVPAGVVHAYECISKKSGWVINLPDKLYKGKNKKGIVDEIRWEAQENSPFVIK